MFYRLRMAFARFMQGRYGFDALNNFLSIVYIALVVSGLILKRISPTAYLVFYILEMFVFFFWLFRVLSRNIYSRQMENTKFLRIRENFKIWKNLQSQKWQFRKTHIFKKCPNCKANIKLPRKKGKHTVTCPKCTKDFKVKI